MHNRIRYTSGKCNIRLRVRLYSLVAKFSKPQESCLNKILLIMISSTILSTHYFQTKSIPSVQFATVSEATRARQSLHGAVWPLTSPKTLNVDYAEDERVSFFEIFFLNFM